ncbi:MAG: hypothetical protein D3M94_07305 [Rhodocyclales bacterium GT-UBC]|nr:MAG: hypothetical protein D3M94_07305 [Rhodocyclales bacterium GT-UBC]
MTTRGRKTLPSVIEQTEPISAETVAAIEHDMQESAALPAALAEVQENAVALAKQLNYEGSLTVGGLEEEIKFFQRRSVEAVLETGKRLLLLKEVAGHGQFTTSLEGLGIGYELAKKLMAATVKFQNGSRLPILQLPNINQGKLLELLVLDDGEIEALSTGSEVRGIQLDDVDCMSVSELRRALRKEKADKEAELAKAKAGVSGELAAKDKVIADKSRRIAELVEEKNKAECLTDEERHADLERQLMNDTLLAVGSLLPIRQAVFRIRSLEQCPQGLYVAMQGSLDRVIAEAMSIASDFGILLNLAASGEFEDDPNAGEEVGLPLADFGPEA